MLTKLKTLHFIGYLYIDLQHYTNGTIQPKFTHKAKGCIHYEVQFQFEDEKTPTKIRQSWKDPIFLLRII